MYIEIIYKNLKNTFLLKCFIPCINQNNKSYKGKTYIVRYTSLHRGFIAMLRLIDHNTAC